MNGRELMKAAISGEPDAIDIVWDLILWVADDVPEAFKVLPLGEIFRLVAEMPEVEGTLKANAEWLEASRRANPEQAEEYDFVRELVLAKLSAKACNRTLVPWCQRHRLDPLKVASFTFEEEGWLCRRPQ